MRRFVQTAVLMILLCGICTGCKANNSVQDGLHLRTSLLQAQGCSFTADLTAFDGDYVEQVVLGCLCERGSTSFSVQEPELLAGLSGTLRSGSLEVDYDGLVLALDLCDDTIPAASAPQILYDALTGGYLANAGADGKQTCICYLLETQSGTLQVQLWLDDDIPIRCEIGKDDAVVIKMDILDFQLL